MGEMRGVRAATALLVALHFALMLTALPGLSLQVPDAGYHVAMARGYAENGTLFWDSIHYAPKGRPNLYGPGLHAVVGGVGLALGGQGEDYVLVHTVLCYLQWLFAVATVIYFGRRVAGEWGGLFAAALFAGSALASGQYSVGMPFGWSFLIFPWAIHFFLRRRLVLCTIATCASVYTHLGGFVLAPAGLLVAALLERRGRDLCIVGAATACLTLPYSLHVIRHLDWYRGFAPHEHMPSMFDPLNHLLAAGAALAMLRAPRRHAFLLSCLAAPASWALYSPERALFQTVLAGCIAGGWLLARLQVQLARSRRRLAFGIAAVLVATLFPLAPPSWFVRVTPLGSGPLLFSTFDFADARAVANTIEDADLTDRLVSHYAWGAASGLAVYAPIRFVKGHWVVVRPNTDPADFLSAGEKVYVVLAPADDPVLRAADRQDLLRVHGGHEGAAVVTLGDRESVQRAGEWTAEVVAREGRWLAKHAVRNDLLSRVRRGWFDSEGFERHRKQIQEQGTRASRIQLALLVLAHALEPSQERLAWQLRQLARLEGRSAAFLADAGLTNAASPRRHREMQRGFARLALQARRLREPSRAARALVTDLERYRAGFDWIEYVPAPESEAEWTAASAAAEAYAARNSRR